MLIVRVEVMYPVRVPKKFWSLMLLPSLANLVDAMDGHPFRFHREPCAAGRISWSATLCS